MTSPTSIVLFLAGAGLGAVMCALIYSRLAVAQTAQAVSEAAGKAAAAAPARLSRRGRQRQARREVTLVAEQPSAGLAFVEGPVAAAGRAYATRAVMQRLHQQHFRRIVLKAYRNQCSICRLGYLDLLDAAHILEDKHPKGEPIVTNGLGMCKIHHSAFDARILGVDPDARVHIRLDVLKKKDGPMLKHGLQELHGTSLVLPIKSIHRPNRDFLGERFELFKSA